MTQLSLDDQDIIKQALSGNQGAYENLVDKYFQRLTWHLFAMVKDRDIAEDLCQEAFIKAHRSLSKYNASYQFSTWLYRIGTNLALDHLRKKQTVSLEDIPELPAEELEIDELDERVGAMRLAIQTLPLKYQTVISLYYWQNLNYEQIAKVMDVPVGTVRTWLHRAKQELRSKL
jgi:RNA polymerase sigma-70 factor, ECF subfamily